MKKNQDTQRAMLDVNCGTDEKGIPQGPGEILKDTKQRLEFRGREIRREPYTSASIFYERARCLSLKKIGVKKL